MNTPTALPRARRAALLGALAVLLVLPACASGSTGDTQPAPGVTTFRGGAFDQLPRYPRSDAVGRPAEEGDVVSQSFSVPGAAPADILGFYEDRLQGWLLVEPIEEVGDDVYRGTWSRDGRHLMVSASPAPTLEPASPPRPITQYNLQLGPAAAVP